MGENMTKRFIFNPMTGNLDTVTDVETNIENTFTEVNKFSNNIVLPKTQGYGIKIDTATPTFGWRDLEGQIIVKGLGLNDPDWTVYRGSIYQYGFTNGKLREAWLNFHVPHDWVFGTDMYIHTHWSQIALDTGGAGGIPGNIAFYYDISYADGHGTAGGHQTHL